MEAYKNWVRQNKDYVHSLESLANVRPFPFEFVLFFSYILEFVPSETLEFIGYPIVLALV